MAKVQHITVTTRLAAALDAFYYALENARAAVPSACTGDSVHVSEFTPLAKAAAKIAKAAERVDAAVNAAAAHRG